MLCGVRSTGARKAWMSASRRSSTRWLPNGRPKSSGWRSCPTTCICWSRWIHNLASHLLVRLLKGRSSRMLRQEFPRLRSRLPTLWANSYLVATVGGAPLAVIEAVHRKPEERLSAHPPLFASCRCASAGCWAGVWPRNGRRPGRCTTPDWERRCGASVWCGSPRRRRRRRGRRKRNGKRTSAPPAADTSSPTRPCSVTASGSGARTAPARRRRRRGSASASARMKCRCWHHAPTGRRMSTCSAPAGGHASREKANALRWRGRAPAVGCAGRATTWCGAPLSLRWQECPCGAGAQRDLYSAHLARFVYQAEDGKYLLDAGRAAEAWPGAGCGEPEPRPLGQRREATWAEPRLDGFKRRSGTAPACGVRAGQAEQPTREGAGSPAPPREGTEWVACRRGACAMPLGVGAPSGG